MKLYNTRTRKTESFSPLDPALVRMYSCGPTVYDHAHIGNLSAYIFADTLRRFLQASGYRVLHGMNYTDVDDKTIRRSRETYPHDDPNAALHTLTDRYIAIFARDMLAVGNDIGSLTFLRATDPDVIAGMQARIGQLIAGGFAYVAEDGVYFSIDAYRKSGKTYGQLTDIALSLSTAARIQNDEYDKASAQDFALWKKQKPGEPAWDFTVGGVDMRGRPGWHIECSVMSRQLLGQPFDIHTGGVDLIFPHHENEIAQSTAGEENPVMATVFAHNAHILVDGAKMAKSAGNFYTLRDIRKHGFDPIAFRLLVLQAHYRSQTHFSWENLAAAQNRLMRWQAVADMRWQMVRPEYPPETIPHNQAALDHTAAAHPHTLLLADQAADAFMAAMHDDLDTPQALVVAERLFAAVEQAGMTPSYLPGFTKLLQQIDRVFGISLFTEDITSEQKRLIAEREAARTRNDWKTADHIRETLLAAGIAIRDSPSQTLWTRHKNRAGD